MSVTATGAVAARGSGRDGRWLAEPGLGVYVHVPFCLHRCHYCDFNTYEGLEALRAPYVDALISDIQRWPETSPRIGRVVQGPATSVFFGGGTPTLLPASELGRILLALAGTIGLDPGAEVTVEANPETVDGDYFERLLDAGFNRVSIGVQSLRDRVLARLGRTHDGPTALAALAAAKAAGVPDLNADLIYGSPWETDDDWRVSLEGTLAAGPDHISAYALTVEEGTPLATLVRTGRVPDVDPDVQASRHATADQILETAGFHRYEVSNWAKPDRASAHNVLYWSAGDYLGFGAGAHAHVAGRRWWGTRLPRAFVSAAERGASTEAGSEVLEADERVGEALMLGLRLRHGVDLPAFARRFGADGLAARWGEIDALTKEGLLDTDGSRLCLAEDATFVANEALCRLL